MSAARDALAKDLDQAIDDLYHCAVQFGEEKDVGNGATLDYAVVSMRKAVIEALLAAESRGFSAGYANALADVLNVVEEYRARARRVDENMLALAAVQIKSDIMEALATGGADGGGKR